MSEVGERAGAQVRVDGCRKRRGRREVEGGREEGREEERQQERERERKLTVQPNSDKNHDSRITIDEFKEYCLDNTDVKSWIDYYDDISENWTAYDADTDPVEFAKAVQSENVVKTRSIEEAMALAGERGALERRDRLTGRKVGGGEGGRERERERELRGEWKTSLIQPN